LAVFLLFTWLKVPEGVEGKKLVVMWDARGGEQSGVVVFMAPR
jgi:hypothetical protein